MRLDDALVDPAGAPVVFRDVLDLTGNALVGSDLDGRLGPETLVVIDAWQGGSPWLDGAPFVIDAARIEQAAARAAHAAERGAVVALSLAAALEPGGAATAILEPSARGAARALLLREAVARFGQLRRLLWLGVSDPGLAQRLGALDPLGRPVFERLPAQTTRAPGAAHRSRAAAPKLEKKAIPTPSPRNAEADGMDEALTAAPDVKPTTTDAKTGTADARPETADAKPAASAPVSAPNPAPSADTPSHRRADHGDPPPAKPRVAEPKPASEAKPRLARRLADKAPKISLSSFWPIPRSSAAAASAVDEGEVDAGEVDAGEVDVGKVDEGKVDAPSPESLVAQGRQSDQGERAAHGARAASPEPGDDRAKRPPPGWREEGSAAIKATLYAIRQRRRGDIEAADRLEISNGLDLASLADASLAVELSGAEAADVRVVRLLAFDESGAALAERSEPFDNVALFATPLEDLGGARRFELQARTGEGAPAAKTWTGEVLRPAGALHADADAPSGPAQNRSASNKSALSAAGPDAPAPDMSEPAAPGPRGSALRRPEPSGRTAPRLDRVDFVDPETDRLLLVWRDGGATPGPLPSATMIASVIGRAVARAGHVVATLAFDDAPPLRREAAASVDERGLVCVFYDVALDARVESVTLELFESPDSARPFAVTSRNR